MKKAGISPDWGGKREGSGRKGHLISETEKKKLLKSLKVSAKKEGKTWQDILTKVVYEGKDKEQTTALKLVAEILITKESHMVREEHKYEHGVVELPPLRPKEEKEVATA